MSKTYDVFDDHFVTDILIVGGGLAGCMAAIEASKYTDNVTLTVNGKIGRSGCTPLAGGPTGADFMVDSKSIAEYLHLDKLGPEAPDLKDSKEIFKKDILSEGEYINNQRMVDVYVSSAPEVMKNLIDMGLKVTAITSAHGSRYPRGVIALNKDIAETMRRNVRKNSITVLEDFRVIDLLTSNLKCIGGIGLDIKKGELVLLHSKAAIIATGGWQMAYHTGGSDELTGDGQAMSFRAGAELIDMEMATFMDRYLIHPPFASRDNFVWNWASEREITNNSGELIIKDQQAGMEALKKLELFSKEITYARNCENGTLILKNPDETLKNGYIKLRDFLNQWNYENTIFAITVGCHYCSGGIRVNEKTETTLKGLYAIGEASGGLFGARRIASALTEASVQGIIAGRNSIECCEKPIVKPSEKSVRKIMERIEKPLTRRRGISPSNLFKKLRNLSSRYLALYRTEKLLKILIGNLEKLRVDISENISCSYGGRIYNKEWMDSLSLENLLLCLDSSAISSLVRRETRGFHRRADYPARNDDVWLKNIVIKNFEGNPTAHIIPIVGSFEV